jgi:putative oxidoreductase
VIRWMAHPPVTGPVTIFIIRLLPGVVFAYEGILNLMMDIGTGGIFGFFCAIACLAESLLLVAGLFTRIAALLVIIHSTAAVFITGIGGITCCDYAQILSGLFLMLEGAGRWSLGFYIATNRQPIFKINQNI